MQVAAQAAAEASALKEQVDREPREALERQLRPRKRKRKTINKEEEQQASISNIKIGLALFIVTIILGLLIVLYN